MSGCKETPPSLLSRILEKLGCSSGERGAKDPEGGLLSSLSAECRQYLQQTLAKKWPGRPSRPVSRIAAEVTQAVNLKMYLGWALKEEHFQKATAAMLLLENSCAGALDGSLLHDVMEYVEGRCPDDVIPPQLLVSWAKHLQVKGALHAAIRRLNTAKTLLVEHKAAFSCQCEGEQIRGDCSQLAGLTLNKMCCWKSAIEPLMESIETFRSCAASDSTNEAIMISLEMVAKCLCNITHGDFLDLKEPMGFQHNDRFFEAYTLCKESASLVVSTEPLYIRAQNQAAESLLKFIASQEEDITLQHQYLEVVIKECHDSLQTHSAVSQLARREQFFEFIRSLSLIFLAMNFSDTPKDRSFANKLEEQAKLLYADYCQQLSEHDFLLDKLDLESCRHVIGNLAEELSLNLQLQGLGSKVPNKRYVTECEKDKPIIAEKWINGQPNGDMQGTFSHRKQDAARSVAQLKAFFERNCVMPEQQQNGNGHTSGMKYVDNQGTPLSFQAPRHHREVGLPIDPEDYNIPVYDVPRSIFQVLCGCKFTGVNDNVESPQDHVLGEVPKYNADGQRDSKPLLGITQDSGYGSSVALVDTFLTTKLAESETLPRAVDNGGVNSSGFVSSGVFNGLSRVCTNGRIEESVSSPATSVKKARLLKYNPVTGLWSCQTTLVYVGNLLQLDDKLKGNCRDAMHVQFLHQDEVLGRYVGKRYRRQRPPSQYLQDVTCQKTARFLVTLFNYALKDLRYDIQVVYVPVAHVQLLSHDGQEVEDWLNVEPYLEGDFVKLTNNLKFCNSQGRTLATALTHFTHSVSEGKLMLVDLQGWLPREGRGVVYLTDPQFHTRAATSLSSCDMGQRGMQAFWDSVHPQCNTICHALGLHRPEEK